MSVVISPATTTSPVVISVSHATRPFGSPPMTASRTESETWSAILSGWPSVTDSELKENERFDMRARLADAQEGGERRTGLLLRTERKQSAHVRRVRRHMHAGEREERERLGGPVHESGRLVGHARILFRLEERGVGRELRPAGAEGLDPRLRRGDDELAADDRSVQGELRERTVLRSRRDELVERGRGPRRVRGLRDERVLRRRPSRADVERRLAAEQRVEAVRKVERLR